MRLTQKEIESIKSVTREVFGAEAEVMLFGSRTDDQSRGGDIDLIIRIKDHRTRSEVYRQKLNYLVKLKKLIGDQKIDLFISMDEKPKSLVEAVRAKAITL